MLVTQSPSPMDNLPNMLSVLEEETNVDIDEVFPPHVDTSNIIIQPESPSSKKQTLKTFNEVNALLQAGRKREVKLILRENAWPLNNGIRAQLWPALCNQHAHGKSMLDGFYWDMVSQVLGTTGQFIPFFQKISRVFCFSHCQLHVQVQTQLIAFKLSLRFKKKLLILYNIPSSPISRLGEKRISLTYAKEAACNHLQIYF